MFIGSGLIVRALSEQDLTGLFYVRETPEGTAARLAAKNATQSEIADIKVLLEDKETVRRNFINWCVAPRTTIDFSNL